MPKVTAEKPLNVKETTLPGVGKKYVMALRQGGNLALIIKPDGDRQMYHFREDEDRPCDVVKVDEEESQQLANLLGRPMLSAPDLDKLELALGDIEIEWVTLSETSPMVGKTLGDIPLRSKTGASIIAIMRGEQALPNPDINTVFEAGDTVLIIGTSEQCDATRELLER